MIQKASTTILLLPLLGVRSEQIYHVVKRGTSRETSCNRGVSSFAPDGDPENVAGSLLQRISAVPAENPDEEATGAQAGAGKSSNTSFSNRPDKNVDLPLQTNPSKTLRAHGNHSGSTVWFSWFATLARLPSLLWRQRYVLQPPTEASAVENDVIGVSAVKVTDAGSSESNVGRHALWRFPSLARLSQHALLSKGKNAMSVSFALGEWPCIVAALIVSLLVVVICLLANLPKESGHATASIQQMDPSPRSVCHLPSPSHLRPGTGLGSAISPVAVNGPVMHTGMPPSMATLPSVQAVTTAPASCPGLHPRKSLEQALNAATRMSLPSFKEMRSQLCVELVVPPGKECCLQLPAHPVGFLGDGGHIAVNDVQGRPVFDVGFIPIFGAARSRWGGFAREDQKDLDKRLVLRSAVDSYVFGSCKTNARLDAKGSRIGLTLCNSTDSPFGVLQQDTSGDFMMKAHDCWFVKVADCGQTYQRLEDSDGWLLASVEGSDNIKIARIAPQVDAGLIVLVLLGIDLILQGLVGQ